MQLLKNQKTDVLFKGVMSNQNEPLNIYELATRVQFLEEKIMDGIEQLKESHKCVRSDVSKIKQAVYDPDKGLYARLKVVENTRDSDSKVIWLIFSGLAGGFITFLGSMLMN